MKFHGLAAIALLMAVSACTGRDAAAAAGNEAARAALTTVTVTSATGRHVFRVELASTEPQQQRGLMYRTDIPKDGGMLFAPYPTDGSGPREASFWMKNTPSPLDIIFIRADGTIARIAENTVPFSEAQVPSGEPISAVLELNGGRSAELGIAEGDKVSWK
ncbi:DUF192 domain-containing protein [Sphingomonas radiodurans]|uniref:DUF192 domain-containing protein n=1 Tax=Sphingomonas radiodurans TaxID=2890321 RepID=UPI001E3E1C24|nr:DUF192 domain-containing protein [Sphingomonas radiodurans]WBH17630.1 DUF192 domain-containing protein [Sphingomonas radiodurans]